MANIEYKPIWSEDGQTLSNVLVKDKLETYNVVTEWYDGTPIDDSKLDSDLVYVKYEGKYLVRNFEYGQVLQKDTMQEMRDLSSYEILLLKMGVYKHVQLNGYYEKGDTPSPISYSLSNTVEEDNGGGIIEVDDAKLEHDFRGVVDVRYFGIFEESPPEFNRDTINYILYNYKEVNLPEHSELEVSPSIDGVALRTVSGNIINGRGCSLKMTPNGLGTYAIFKIEDCEDVVIKNIGVIGERHEHTGTTGEWGMGVDVRSSKRVVINEVSIESCWGDGVYIGRNSTGLSYCEDIVIKDCIIKDNRRNGISIITVDGLSIIGNSIIETIGTDPQSGIDFEPNYPDERVSRVVIKENNIFNSNYAGILIALGRLNHESKYVSIDINNNTIDSDRWGFQELGGRFGISAPSFFDNENVVRGRINISDNIISNTYYGGINIGRIYKYPDFYIQRNMIIDANRQGAINTLNVPFRVFNASHEGYTRENSSKIVIEDNKVYVRNIPQKTYIYDIRGSNQDASILAHNIQFINNSLVHAEGGRKIDDYYLLLDNDIVDEVGELTLVATSSPIDIRTSRKYRVITNKNRENLTRIVLYPSRDKIPLRIINESGYQIDLQFASNKGEFVGYEGTEDKFVRSVGKGDIIEVVSDNFDTNSWVVNYMEGNWETDTGVIMKVSNKTSTVTPVVSTDLTPAQESVAIDVEGIVEDVNNLIDKFNESVAMVNEIKGVVNDKLNKDVNSGQQIG